MKHAILRVFCFIIALQVIGCSYNPFTAPANFTAPASPLDSQKEVFVVEGNLDQPYLALGPVEYTLKNDFSIFSGQPGLRSEAVAFLKQEALARYGDKVDAIINVEFQEGAEEGFFSPSFTYVRGLAVTFKSEPESINKPKRKYKSKAPKHYPSKTKATNTVPRKPKPKLKQEEQEPEISPEEMLK